jgi:thioredoxin reductase (NADPH)
MLLRRGEMRASKIMQQRALSNPKIELVKFSVVDEVLGQDDLKVGVTGVRIRNVETNATSVLEATGMFLAIGHTPNTKFLGGQIQTRENGYIAWTQPYRTITSVEGVFAAGDVADDYYRQAITSSGTGCMAALDAERYLAHAGIH